MAPAPTTRLTGAVRHVERSRALVGAVQRELPGHLTGSLATRVGRGLEVNRRVLARIERDLEELASRRAHGAVR